MVQKTRYAKLCDAYRAGVRKCDVYRHQCRDFVSELRLAVLANFECPETRLILFPPSQGFSTKSPMLPGDPTDIEFMENGDSIIGFAINANDRPTEHQNMFFTFIVRFRSQRDKLVFGIADDEEEFPGDDDGMATFCDYLFDVARENLIHRLDVFLQNDQDSFPIGFRVGQDETT